MNPPETPQTIGRYRILQPLGEGGMGTVYLAEDPRIGRRLAIKTVRISGNTRDMEENKKRLLMEARAAGRLLHPNVVTLFDADEVDGLLFLAFEYVPGSDLSRRLTSDPPLTLRQVLQLLREIAGALDQAHQADMVHRDIKPSNVLIAPDGTAKVADFGLAKLKNESLELTRTGSVLGSPQYMSPEQVRGEPLDGRSDIFSLGVLAYEMLSRIRPFGGETISTLVFEILSKDPMAIDHLRPGLPPRLVNLVHSMLAKDLVTRMFSAAAVVAEVDAVLRETPAVELDAPAVPPVDDVAPTRLMSSSAPSPPPPPHVPTATIPSTPPSSLPSSPSVPSPPPTSTMGVPGTPAPPPPPHTSPPTHSSPQPPPPTSTVGVSSSPAPPPPPHTSPPTHSSPQPSPMASALGTASVPAADSGKRRTRVAGALAMAALVLVLLLALGGGGWWLLKSFGKGQESTTTTAEQATIPSEAASPPLDSSNAAGESSIETTTSPTAGGEEISDVPTTSENNSQIPSPAPTQDNLTSPTPTSQSPPRSQPVTSSPPSSNTTAPPTRSTPPRSTTPPSTSSASPPPSLERTIPRSETAPAAETTAPTAPEPEIAQHLADFDQLATRAQRKISSGRFLTFQVDPEEALIRVWRRGDERQRVMGQAKNYAAKGKNADSLELPEAGQYLITLIAEGFPDFVIYALAKDGGSPSPHRVQVALRVASRQSGRERIRVSRSLAFKGSPNDAEVYVNGTRQGPASRWPGGGRAGGAKNLQLTPGLHKIRIEADGHEPYEFEVEVTRSARRRVQTINYALRR